MSAETHITPDVAAEEAKQLQTAADLELVAGYRESVRFLFKVEEVSGLNVNDAYDALASAFARAVTITG